MDKPCGMLVINVGSTSTKLAWFKGDNPMMIETICYDREELALYPSILDQLSRREEDVLEFLRTHGIDPANIDMVVSRGGLGRPAPAGAYEVDNAMCRDLIEGKYGKHPSALRPAIALNFSTRYGSRAIVVDPPSTDEFHPLARISGLPKLNARAPCTA